MGPYAEILIYLLYTRYLPSFVPKSPKKAEMMYRLGLRVLASGLRVDHKTRDTYG